MEIEKDEINREQQVHLEFVRLRKIDLRGRLLADLKNILFIIFRLFLVVVSALFALVAFYLFSKAYGKMNIPFAAMTINDLGIFILSVLGAFVFVAGCLNSIFFAVWGEHIDFVYEYEQKLISVANETVLAREKALLGALYLSHPEKFNPKESCWCGSEKRLENCHGLRR